ncbi:MAG: RluA family pseudouridine synthase [Bacteroidales bacterium]|nr:RluA family pseudouridine synthase [Bacteroidales bacterium]
MDDQNILENLETDNQFSQDELFEHFRFVVDPGQSLLRIDKFLNTKIANISRTKIQAAIQAGNVLVNENKIKSNYKVKPNDIISVLLSFPKLEFELIAEDIPLEIVFEDKDLLVVNKEAGMVVHPAPGHSRGTLVNALAYYLQDNDLFSENNIRPGLVHRIDKNTSGLLVIGKNELTLSGLGKQFYEQSTKRLYHALVWGNLPNDEGTITGNIGRNLSNRKIMAVFNDENIGKPAVTHYKVLKRFNYCTYVECRLETGRTHQIRVHFSNLGYPLFNDAEYGGDKILKGPIFNKYKQFVENCFKICPRQALHAKVLGFKHPTTKEKIVLESDLPNDFAQLIDKWESYYENKNV